MTGHSPWPPPGAVAPMRLHRGQYRINMTMLANQHCLDLDRSCPFGFMLDEFGFLKEEYAV